MGVRTLEKLRVSARDNESMAAAKEARFEVNITKNVEPKNILNNSVLHEPK